MNLRTKLVLRFPADPGLEEDAELRVFGGKGGDVVKSLNEDLDLQPVSAEVRFRPLPTRNRPTQINFLVQVCLFPPNVCA